MNIGIVGLGLMGGSMAKSIKTKTGHSVFAKDTNDETMLMANLTGALDSELDKKTLPMCDIIFLALRPGIAIKWLEANADNINF